MEFSPTTTSHDFKLIELTDREYWVRDRFHYNILGIYQALITSKPRNSILKKIIDNIVELVKKIITEIHLFP